MGGQVMGGGVIVLVAVVLWLVYLLPSWHGRHQYNAAERNAVRLNQALRILAETSETPEEVRLELNARTALHQQKLAKRAHAERESAELEAARADLEAARAELAAARAVPAARRARARRRARLTATFVGVAAIALAGWGVWDAVTTGTQVALWSGIGLAVVCAVMLSRMARVRSIAASRASVTVEAPMADAPALPADLLEDRGWTPRSLPRPLSASVGSRAAAELDSAEARRALREAAREEALRARAESLRPAPADLTSVRAARAAASDADTFERAGGVDDAAIEAHVRQMLARRAAG